PAGSLRSGWSASASSVGFFAPVVLGRPMHDGVALSPGEYHFPRAHAPLMPNRPPIERPPVMVQAPSDHHHSPVSASLMPSAIRERIREDRSDALMPRALSRMAMRAARGVMYCGTGTGAFGFELSMPPAQPAASASQVSPSLLSARVPTSSALDLRSSLGSRTQASAARRLAAPPGGISSRKALAHPHAHHTASRRGSR